MGESTGGFNGCRVGRFLLAFGGESSAKGESGERKMFWKKGAQSLGRGGSLVGQNVSSEKSELTGTRVMPNV